MRYEQSDTERVTWMAVSGGAALLAAAVAKRALRRGWKAARGRELPKRAGKDVGWAEMILVTAATAAVVAVVELLAREGAARGWKRVTGSDVPDV